MLTIDKPHATQSLVGILPQPAKKICGNQLITESYPSYLHLATIYAEYTQDEKETFGTIRFDFGQLTEEKIDWLTDQYLGVNAMPIELINETINRCKQKFQSQLFKLDAAVN